MKAWELALLAEKQIVAAQLLYTFYTVVPNGQQNAAISEDRKDGPQTP